MALGVACGGEGGGTASDDASRLHATVVRPHSDTLGFAVPATAHRCDGGRALLLQAGDERGNGVLAMLRYGDSLASGSFALIALGDSLTARGANVAVRYMQVDMAHGLSLDSGSVDLTVSEDALGAKVRGSGLEGGVRVALDATYQGVPRPAAHDTVPCRFQP